MTLLDNLRQHAGIPDAYSWATLGVTVTEARELVERFDHLVNLLALRDEVARGLRAELAAATRRCADCGRSSRELTPWEEQGQVVAWLGPSCHRRRLDGQQVAALPIGATQ